MGSEGKAPTAGGKGFWSKSVVDKGVWRKAPEASQALGDFSILLKITHFGLGISYRVYT